MDRSTLRSNERIEGGKKGEGNALTKIVSGKWQQLRRCDLQRDRFERIYNNVTDVSMKRNPFFASERINKINLFEKF